MRKLKELRNQSFRHMIDLIEQKIEKGIRENMDEVKIPLSWGIPAVLLELESACYNYIIVDQDVVIKIGKNNDNFLKPEC